MGETSVGGGGCCARAAAAPRPQRNNTKIEIPTARSPILMRFPRARRCTVIHAYRMQSCEARNPPKVGLAAVATGRPVPEARLDVTIANRTLDRSSTNRRERISFEHHLAAMEFGP